MKVDLEIVNDDASYRDLEIYVVEDTGAEWKFRVYLDKESGLILESDPMYSPNRDDAFEETDLPVPPAVRDALSAQRPRVHELLKGESK